MSGCRDGVPPTAIPGCSWGCWYILAPVPDRMDPWHELLVCHCCAGPACAVLAASLHASPHRRGSHSCSAMAFPALPHKLCCASMLACSCHAPSSPPAPFLGSMFPVHLLGYYNYIFFCKFLFEHFVIVNKENETF